MGLQLGQQTTGTNLSMRPLGVCRLRRIFHAAAGGAGLASSLHPRASRFRATNRGPMRCLPARTVFQLALPRLQSHPNSVRPVCQV